MPTYRVRLERRLDGAPVGSTDDRVEASTATEAEAKAIEDWKAAAPRYTFAPLLTIEDEDGDEPSSSATGLHSVRAELHTRRYFQQMTTGVLHVRRSCGVTSRTRYDHAELELTDAEAAAYEHCGRCWPAS
jgi:hypothetical protein